MGQPGTYMSLCLLLLVLGHSKVTAKVKPDLMILTDSTNQEIYVFPVENPDASASTKIPFSSSIFNPGVVDYDPVDEKVYFTDDGSDSMGGSDYIGKVKADGTEFEQIISITDPRGLALDVEERKLYFTNAAGGVYCASLDGTGVENIVDIDDNFGADSIVLDRPRRKIYFVKVGGATAADEDVIKRCDYDGANVEDIHSGSDTVEPKGLTMNEDDEVLMWVDGVSGDVYTGGSGNSAAVIFTASEAFTSIQLYYLNLYMVQDFTSYSEIQKTLNSNYMSETIDDVLTVMFSPPSFRLFYTKPCISGIRLKQRYSSNTDSYLLTWSEPRFTRRYHWCEADEVQVHDVSNVMGSTHDYTRPWQTENSLELVLQDGVNNYTIEVTARNTPADGQSAYEGESYFVKAIPVYPVIVDAYAGGMEFNVSIDVDVTLTDWTIELNFRRQVFNLKIENCTADVWLHNEKVKKQSQWGGHRSTYVITTGPEYETLNSGDTLEIQMTANVWKKLRPEGDYVTGMMTQIYTMSGGKKSHQI